MNQFIDNVSPCVRTLKPYIPGKPIEELQREYGLTNIIKLASNENPYGASPKAIAAAKKSCEQLNFYPDGSGYNLKKEISKFIHVETDKLCLGSGSEDILSMIARTFCQQGDETIYSQYGFGMFPIMSLGAKANPIAAPAKNWGHDLDAMHDTITDKTKIIFIANPNNPTGTWNTEQEYLSLLKNIPKHIIVVSDEAYFEFMDEDTYPNTLALQKEFPNLIISRTFSKAYGLAGIRIAYAIAHPDIIDLLNRVRHPFNVNLVAEQTAIAAIKDQEFVQHVIEMNHKEKSFLLKQYQTMGLKTIPSKTNFITVDMGQNAMPYYDKLLKKGIIVRPLVPYEMPNFLRISIGNHEQNERLINALREIITA